MKSPGPLAATCENCWTPVVYVFTRRSPEVGSPLASKWRPWTPIAFSSRPGVELQVTRKLSASSSATAAPNWIPAV